MTNLFSRKRRFQKASDFIREVGRGKIAGHLFIGNIPVNPDNPGKQGIVLGKAVQEAILIIGLTLACMEGFTDNQQ